MQTGLRRIAGARAAANRKVGVAGLGWGGVASRGRGGGVTDSTDV